MIPDFRPSPSPGAVFPVPTFVCTAVFVLVSIVTGVQYAEAPPRRRQGGTGGSAPMGQWG